MHNAVVHLRPNVFLVDTTAAHALDHLLGFLFINSSFLCNNLSENFIDLSGHMGSVTANIEVGLLL